MSNHIYWLGHVSVTVPISLAMCVEPYMSNHIYRLGHVSVTVPISLAMCVEP
jgi:hypothetical protein